MLRKSFIIAFLIVIAIFFYFWYLVAYSFYDTDRDAQDPFTADQCTLLSGVSWQRCCEIHDKRYWQGGSKKSRLQADKDLRYCILKKTNNFLLTATVYEMARVSGVPYFAFPWRWGYGWTFGRGYR